MAAHPAWKPAAPPTQRLAGLQDLVCSRFRALISPLLPASLRSRQPWHAGPHRLGHVRPAPRAPQPPNQSRGRRRSSVGDPGGQRPGGPAQPVSRPLPAACWVCPAPRASGELLAHPPARPAASAGERHAASDLSSWPGCSWVTGPQTPAQSSGAAPPPAPETRGRHTSSDADSGCQPLPRTEDQAGATQPRILGAAPTPQA